MEFITPYINLEEKSHIVWGLFYFKPTSIFFDTIILEDPLFDCM